jgi:hypothetical protein
LKPLKQPLLFLGLLYLKTVNKMETFKKLPVIPAPRQVKTRNKNFCVGRISLLSRMQTDEALAKRASRSRKTTWVHNPEMGKKIAKQMLEKGKGYAIIDNTVYIIRVSTWPSEKGKLEYIPVF